jgi:hypothetical protein
MTTPTAPAQEEAPQEPPPPTDQPAPASATGLRLLGADDAPACTDGSCAL